MMLGCTSSATETQKTECIPADTIIICAGQTPNRDLEQSIRQNGQDPIIIGGANVAAEARRQKGHR